jgi:uncharacterized membrane protein YeaQ/YmgE (transglycosylase-associated protein family)
MSLTPVEVPFEPPRDFWGLRHAPRERPESVRGNSDDDQTVSEHGHNRHTADAGIRQPRLHRWERGASVILLFILVWGMFAGWIAHLLLARSQPINWAELLVVGLAGSFVGGLLISLVSGDGLALRPSGIIGSIVGAVVLLAAWRTIRPTPRRRTR